MGTHLVSRSVVRLLAAVGAAWVVPGAFAVIQTAVTTDEAALIDALSPLGLAIDQVVLRAGTPGQIGTYSNFVDGPVSIRRGVVLSSGNIAQIGPFPEALDPGYDPASPPQVVNNAMHPTGGGGTAEFDEFGHRSNNIENFQASYDVASIEVHFTLDQPAQVQFDFIFGSVEFPFWTSQFTDAFLVFIDGVQPNDQITFDNAGNAVQVGSSFAGLETTADVNTAFSNPHGLIHHLTTTTQELDKGPHVLIFEVGDVNDQVLDSAAFIANLRTGVGTPGTQPSDDDFDDCPGDINSDGDVNTADIVRFLGHFGESVTPHHDGDLNADGFVDTADLVTLLAHFGAHC